MALDPIEANRWLSEKQRKLLIASIEARKTWNMAHLLPGYSINEDGDVIPTPLFVLRTFPPEQPMFDHYGEIMTARQMIERRTKR